MPQTEERNLELTERNVNIRERRHSHAIQFELQEIRTHFENNISSVKCQFELFEQLNSAGNIQCKDILRTQVVFLESAFDFFMHEITKYGMMQIFQRAWDQTARYNNFTIKLGDVSEALQNPEQENWFLDIVNDSYAEDTFMSADTVVSQLNLIGVQWQAVANRAFYEQGSNTPVNDKFKESLNSLFKRRNQIAHQSDCLHTTGEKIDIDRGTVEGYINDIEKIANAIFEEINEVKNQQ